MDTCCFCTIYLCNCNSDTHSDSDGCSDSSPDSSSDCSSDICSNSCPDSSSYCGTYRSTYCGSYRDEAYTGSDQGLFGRYDFGTHCHGNSRTQRIRDHERIYGSGGR